MRQTSTAWYRYIGIKYFALESSVHMYKYSSFNLVVKLILLSHALVSGHANDGWILTNKGLTADQSEFLGSQATTNLGGILAQGLTCLFVGSLLPNIAPAKVSRRTSTGHFGTLEESATTIVDDLDNLHGNLGLIGSSTGQVTGLILGNELAEELIARMPVGWSSTSTKYIFIS